MFQTLYEEAGHRDEQLKKLKEQQHIESMVKHQRSKSLNKNNQVDNEKKESRNDFFKRLYSEKLASQNSETSTD